MNFFQRSSTMYLTFGYVSDHLKDPIPSSVLSDVLVSVDLKCPLSQSLFSRRFSLDKTP